MACVVPLEWSTRAKTQHGSFERNMILVVEMGWQNQGHYRNELNMPQAVNIITFLCSWRSDPTFHPILHFIRSYISFIFYPKVLKNELGVCDIWLFSMMIQVHGEKRTSHVSIGGPQTPVLFCSVVLLFPPVSKQLTTQNSFKIHRKTFILYCRLEGPQ